jgi:hypothetical protein
MKCNTKKKQKSDETRDEKSGGFELTVGREYSNPETYAL